MVELNADLRLYAVRKQRDTEGVTTLNRFNMIPEWGETTFAEVD